MPKAYISLGSNQGKPADNIKNALRKIDAAEGINITAVSSLYLTEPVGYEEQEWFHNCVAEVDTELIPHELLKILQDIEHSQGRVRTIRWGPRTIDLDILLYDHLVMDDENLTVPHPRMYDRAFVMVPLAEIAEEFKFPDGRTVGEVRQKLGCEKKYSCIQQKIW